MSDEIPAQLAALQGRIAAVHQAADERLTALEGVVPGIAELRADIDALRGALNLLITANEAHLIKQLQFEQRLDRAVEEAKLAPTRAMIVRLLKETQADG